MSRGFFENMKDKKSKEWIVTHPDGFEEKIKGFKCKRIENDLTLDTPTICNQIIISKICHRHSEISSPKYTPTHSP